MTIDELVGVGDDDALDRVGVVGACGAARDVPRLDPHHAGQGVRVAGGVADEADPVADDDALAAQLAGLHRLHDALVVLAADASPTSTV